MWIYVPGSPESSPCAPATEDSTWGCESRAQALAPSATWRGSTRRAVFWQNLLEEESSIQHPSGWMPPPSTASRGVAAWISSLRGYPARGTPSQGSGNSTVIRATSGPASATSFGRWSPASSSWRTCRASLLQSLGRESPRLLPGYSESWPKTGGMRNGRCFLRPTWVPRIAVIASGSWPTPDAQVMNDGQSLESWQEFCLRSKEKHGNGNGHGTTLAIASLSWATTMVQDSKQTGSAISDMQSLHQQASHWPTPMGMAGIDHRGKLGLGGEFSSFVMRWGTSRVAEGCTNSTLPDDPRRQHLLEEQVSALCSPQGRTREPSGSSSRSDTPTSSPHSEEIRQILQRLPDWCRDPAICFDSSARKAAARKQPALLSDEDSSRLSIAWRALQQSYWRARLNPRFVEWLMGLPPGWVTGFTEPTSCDSWAMASSHSVQRLLSASSGRG